MRFLIIIQALDSDMQMLVYENYNKFISATETIKRMKSNVDGMDEDLDSVKYALFYFSFMYPNICLILALY